MTCLDCKEESQAYQMIDPQIDPKKQNPVTRAGFLRIIYQLLMAPAGPLYDFIFFEHYKSWDRTIYQMDSNAFN